MEKANHKPLQRTSGQWPAAKTHSVLLARLNFVLSVLLLTACHQVTIVVKDIPPNTPPGSALFISGNFNYWDPGDQAYALQFNPKDSTYTVTLPKGIGTVDYRFTRGDWTTVEADLCGNPMAAHRLRYQSRDTVPTRILSWKDLGPTRCDQVTFVLDQVPKETPPDAPLYLGNNFNNWQAADPKYRLKRTPDGKYYLRLHTSLPEIEYKITRGSWSTDEVDALGNPIPNRVFIFGMQDTVLIGIPAWRDLLPTARHDDWIAIVVTIPPTTPKDSRIFLTGNFNSWDPHDLRYEMHKLRPGVYTINLPRKREYIEFKFTRGNWSTVEGDAYGNPRENRSFTYGHLDTLNLTVQSWEDLFKDRLRQRIAEK
jgi:hypothetical protein